MVTESEIPALERAARHYSSDRHQHERPTVERFRRPCRRREDLELEVVWSGIGPLPGAGAAAGLGSTLSGIVFSIGKRR
jgi:hypothetical protein